MFIHARLDVLVGKGNPVDKARALVADVDGPHGAQAQVALYQHARPREVIIRAEGGKHHKIDIFGRQPGPFHSDPGRPDPHGSGGVDPGFGIAPLFDPGAFPDPGVAGIHELRQFIIGDYPFGHIEPEPGDP